jgi:hypothetical protein
MWKSSETKSAKLALLTVTNVPGQESNHVWPTQVSEAAQSMRSSQEEIVKILDALFGCWHKRISFPQTSKPGQRRCEAATLTGTYVVCLDCGTEFAYDWKKMRVLSPIEKQPFARASVEVEARG